MKKNEFDFSKVSDRIVNGSDLARNFPFEVGQKFHFELNENIFKPRKATINGEERQWTDVIALDGTISATQLTRNNNGLDLLGATVEDKLKSFVDKFDDNGKLTIKITKLIERKFNDKDGNESTSNYLKFEIA